MRQDDENEAAFKKYLEQVKGLAAAFQHASQNLIDEIEKLGFTYVVSGDEEAEEIREESGARPITDLQTELVSYFDGTDLPSERLVELWCEETRRGDTPFSLWRRYFRAGNSQLIKLILFGLDQQPTIQDLLDDLSILHSFLPMPKEFLGRYTLACDLEDDPLRFRKLAKDFDAGAASFGYDALEALRARCTDKNTKKTIVDGLFLERQKREEGIAF